jgi:hypothetical protein
LEISGWGCCAGEFDSKLSDSRSGRIPEAETDGALTASCQTPEAETGKQFDSKLSDSKAGGFQSEKTGV